MNNHLAIAAQTPKFAKVKRELEFFDILKARVYADLGPKSIKGDAAAFKKALFLVLGYSSVLAIVLLVRLPSLLQVAAAVLLALCSISIGFSVMHDAIHGTLSENKETNRIFGYSLDFLGCSSFFWNYKHNIIHHTYPNIHTYDDDISIPLIRSHEDQTWKPIHRYQHLYWPALYMLTYLAWVYKMDFTKLRDKKIGGSPRKPIIPSRTELFIMILGKCWHVSAVLIAPVFIQGWSWIPCYVLLMVLTGFAISIVFQLAHLVSEVSLVSLPISPENFKTANKVHQIDTTADFSPGNKRLSSALGGLNFQVEHHLFPEIHSRHYPRIQKIVKAACLEYGIPYHCFDTMSQGIGSHVKLLRELGQKPKMKK